MKRECSVNIHEPFAFHSRTFALRRSPRRRMRRLLLNGSDAGCAGGKSHMALPCDVTRARPCHLLPQGHLRRTVGERKPKKPFALFHHRLAPVADVHARTRLAHDAAALQVEETKSILFIVLSH